MAVNVAMQLLVCSWVIARELLHSFKGVSGGFLGTDMLGCFG